MLCSKCKRLIAFAERRGTRAYELHNTFAALEAASEIGCYICSSIFRQLKAELKAADSYHQPLPQCMLEAAMWDDEEEDVWGIKIVLSNLGSLQTKASRWTYRLVPLLHDTDYFGFEIRWLRSRGGRATHTLYPDIPSSTGSQETMSLARHWYRQCQRNHYGCSPDRGVGLTTGRKWYPPRLLDLSPVQPRLVDRDDIEDGQQYATLSHCWGQDTFITLTSDCLESFQHVGIPMTNSPQTFRDAVTICQSLCFRYLWIDSLCIIQTGPGSCEDWADHVVHMCSIYGLSHLCIATATACKATEPVFRVRRTQLVEPVWVFIRPADRDTSDIVTPHLLVAADLAVSGYRTAPLATRAWAFQERLLSPRILTFGKEQIFWECKQTERRNICETFPSGISAPCYSRGPFALPNPAENEFNWREIWQSLLDTYSECQLTRSNEDKLAAFAGIARNIAVDFECTHYIAGFFDFELPRALLWNVRLGVIPQFRPTTTENTYRAPSWSWAATDAPISCWRQDLGLKDDPGPLVVIARIISTCTRPLHEDDAGAFGPLRYAEIELMAPLIAFREIVSSARFRIGERDIDEAQITVYLDSRDDEHHLDQSFFVPILAIGPDTIEGLIVCQTQLPQEHRRLINPTRDVSLQCYRRLGVAIVDDDAIPNDLKIAPEEHIVLI